MNTILDAATRRFDYEDARAEYIASRNGLLDAMRAHAQESVLAQLAHAATAAFNASEEAKHACLGQRAMVLS